MRLVKTILLLAVLLSLLCIATITQAQEHSPQKGRPRVGVALSGGGALGLAHIGVIRYFEEHHIPIDAVAGTSMGGLVGGFYATGMDSAQMTQFVDHTDWNTLLSPNPKFIDQPIVDKQKWNRPFGDVTLRFGKHFSLPAGLNPGESLSLLLSRSTLQYSDLPDFDALPTPYRCVATDLVTGNAVVLRRGSLAKAMRATMSLPAIFTPVRLGDMVLVDGGLVENVPVEVVRDMGAQVVIAVALESPKPKPEQFKSLTDVLRQSAAIAVIQNERRSLAAADIVISVDTNTFSGFDYAKAEDIILAGYEAARANAQALAKFELPDEQWARFIDSRRRKTRPSERQGTVVAVSAPSESFQRNAAAELNRKLDTRVVTQHELEQVLTGMVAATAVPGASYTWQRTQDGTEGYKVEFLQRPGDQVLARPSVQYSFSAGEPSRAALKFSTTTVFENAYKSRLLTTATIGYDPGIRTEYYYPFDGSPYFIAPQLFIERNKFVTYEGTRWRTDTRDSFGGALYGGIGTWRFAQLRLGVQAGYDSYSASRTVDGVPSVSSGFVSPELRWLYNSQDSGGIPTRGTRAEGAIGHSFRQTSYSYLQNDFSTFHSRGRVSVFGISQIGTSFGTKLNFFEQFTTGGQNGLSAFRYQEFHANTAVTGGGGLIVRGPSVRSFSLYPSLVTWYEAGRLDLGSQGWQTHQTVSSGMFFPTPLGAAGLALSVNEAGKLRVRVILGSL